MSEQLQPDTRAATFTDFDRRLRVLESTARSGLQAIRTANGTAGKRVDVYGVWDDLDGDAPQITMETGPRVLLLAQARVEDLGQDVGAGLVDFKSYQLSMGIEIDSTNPDGWPLPVIRNVATNLAYSPTASVSAYSFTQMLLMTSRSDLTAGSHTFKLRFKATLGSAGATVDPLVTDTSLIVIPLGLG